jgi:hypothetical protein
MDMRVAARDWWPSRKTVLLNETGFIALLNAARRVKNGDTKISTVMKIRTDFVGLIALGTKSNEMGYGGALSGKKAL